MPRLALILPPQSSPLLSYHSISLFISFDSGGWHRPRLTNLLQVLRTPSSLPPHLHGGADFATPSPSILTLLAMPSDIQVFVNWKDQTIFAGEDVECTITFRNVAESSNTAESNNSNHHHQQRKQARPSTANTNSDSSFFSLKSPQNLFSSRRSSNSLSPQKKTSHRTSSSLSTPLVGSHSFPPPSTPRNGPSHGHKHKRSVSILSIDSEGGGDKTPVPSSPFNRSRPPPPPPKGHGRSASLQVLPKRNESYDESFPKGMLLESGIEIRRRD